MRNVRIKNSLFAAAAVLGVAAFGASGANAATANGTANATVLTAISIAAVSALDFGSMGNAANTITISTAGVRSATDNSQLAGGTVGAAQFTVTGSGATAYTITLPGAILINNGGNNMTVNNFAHNAGGTPALVGGTDTFEVGADLTVGAAQVTGAYTGTFVMTVNY